MRYYMLVDRRPAGPFEKDALLARADFGADSIVCVVGATTADAWHRAADEPELAGAFRASAAPVVLVPAPVSAPAPAPAPAPADEAPAAVAEDAAPIPLDPSTRLVLLVDDDEDFRSLLEASVKKEGFRVIVAEDGRAATAKLDPAPDLVITDLMMPGEGGYEFMRALQSAGHGGVPVILVTGAVLDPSTVAAMRQDANIVHAFAKPVKISALMNAIHVKLGTARLKAVDAEAGAL